MDVVGEVDVFVEGCLLAAGEGGDEDVQDIECVGGDVGAVGGGEGEGCGFSPCGETFLGGRLCEEDAAGEGDVGGLGGGEGGDGEAAEDGDEGRAEGEGAGGVGLEDVLGAEPEVGGEGAIPHCVGGGGWAGGGGGDAGEDDDELAAVADGGGSGDGIPFGGAGPRGTGACPCAGGAAEAFEGGGGVEDVEGGEVAGGVGAEGDGRNCRCLGDDGGGGGP